MDSQKSSACSATRPAQTPTCRRLWPRCVAFPSDETVLVLTFVLRMVLYVPLVFHGFNFNLQRLKELRFIPNFLAYLAHILVFCTQEAGTHRTVAGLVLKNALIEKGGQPVTDGDAQAMDYVKQASLAGLQESEKMIRHTAGSVVMAILYTENTGAWPQALDFLAKGLSSQDENLVEVSRDLIEANSI